MILHVIVVVGLLVCAVQAIRSPRLLQTALWLAGCSALVALEMYLLGAPEVAVIELSVGAGLVTVLFVFAINIAGEEAVPPQPIVPRPLSLALVAGAMALLAWFLSGQFWNPLLLEGAVQAEFKVVLWEDRMLDVLLLVVLIFAGVLGVLGLLAERQPEAETALIPEAAGPLAEEEGA
jgi:uncharacterized MnhB-related membrane protein